MVLKSVAIVQLYNFDGTRMIDTPVTQFYVTGIYCRSWCTWYRLKVSGMVCAVSTGRAVSGMVYTSLV